MPNDFDTTISALEKKTLNTLNSGPSGGKTTLYAQAIRAHLYHEDFFLPGLKFPEGRIAIVQTDRTRRQYSKTFIPLGLHEHPMIETLNFVDDRSLHNLTKPMNKPQQDLQQLEILRSEISRRLKGKDIGTLILDLYDDFHRGSASGRAAAHDGRTNLQWAQDLDVAILAVLYSFKQTTAKQALRAQDRSSGVLQLQASADWKFTLIDAEETRDPYYTICVTPAPGCGQKLTIPAVRGTPETGDSVGLFSLYSGPILPSLDEIMLKWNCGMTKAYEIKKRLATGEDPEWIT